MVARRDFLEWALIGLGVRSWCLFYLIVGITHIFNRKQGKLCPSGPGAKVGVSPHEVAAVILLASCGEWAWK